VICGQPHDAATKGIHRATASVVVASRRRRSGPRSIRSTSVIRAHAHLPRATLVFPDPQIYTSSPGCVTNEHIRRHVGQASTPSLLFLQTYAGLSRRAVQPGLIDTNPSAKYVA